MKLKKIITITAMSLLLILSTVSVGAATYAPVDSSGYSSSYYTENYIVNRNGKSYSGVARRRTGFISSGGYTLDGHISVIKPTSGSFKHCAVDCVFTRGTRTYSRYNSSVFNTPTTGITGNIDSAISVMKTSSGTHLYDKDKSTTSYKLSNSTYVDTTEALTVYGTYAVYYNGVTRKVSSYVLRY